MNTNERTLLEAFTSMLSSDDLGLDHHTKAHEESNKLERGLEYLHNHVNDSFRLKASDLVHHTGICAAFSKVHSYKYLDDPTFWVALERELKAQAVPLSEQTKAKDILDKVVNELSTFNVAREADFGFSPDLADVIRIPE